MRMSKGGYDNSQFSKKSPVHYWASQHMLDFHHKKAEEAFKEFDKKRD